MTMIAGQTRSLANRKFEVSAEPLKMRAYAWDGEVKIEATVANPYKLESSITLSPTQARGLRAQLDIAIADIEEVQNGAVRD